MFISKIVNMSKKKEINKTPSITDLVKEKIKDHLIEYQKKAIEYVEEQIEEKVTKEINKLLINTVSIFLMILGGLLTFYGIIWVAILYIPFMPSETAPLTVGLILILTGYIIKRKTQE